MKPLFLLGVAPVLTCTLAGLFAVPSAAQDSGGERIMMVNIQEGEECPTADDPDTIVVCEVIDSGDQYRIPRQLRQSSDPANDSWTERSRGLEDVGAFGQGSCSNVGGGSELGCSIEEIEMASAEREATGDNRFSLQIEEARRERLETIDGDAARTQARVEELERAYLERLEAERDAPLPGEEEALPEIVVDPDAIPQRPPAQ